MSTSEPFSEAFGGSGLLRNGLANPKHVAIDSFPRQRDISVGDYEIILMDNGSAKVLDEPTQKILPNLNYIYLMREALQP